MKERYDDTTLSERTAGVLQWLDTQLGNDKVFWEDITENSTINSKNYKTYKRKRHVERVILG